MKSTLLGVSDYSNTSFRPKMASPTRLRDASSTRPRQKLRMIEHSRLALEVLARTFINRTPSYSRWGNQPRLLTGRNPPKVRKFKPWNHVRYSTADAGVVVSRAQQSRLNPRSRLSARVSKLVPVIGRVVSLTYVMHHENSIFPRPLR